MMFLDCPAYLDQDGAERCSLPAEVKSRLTAEAALLSTGADRPEWYSASRYCHDESGRLICRPDSGSVLTICIRSACRSFCAGEQQGCPFTGCREVVSGEGGEWR